MEAYSAPALHKLYHLGILLKIPVLIHWIWDRAWDNEDEDEDEDEEEEDEDEEDEDEEDSDPLWVASSTQSPRIP